MRIIKSGQFALVIDSSNGPGSPTPDQSCGPCGHFVVDRYSIDNHGYIRLTSTQPIGELFASVELFEAELESLLKSAQARYAGLPPP